MHSLLNRSVHWWGRFPVAPSSYINWTKRSIDKYDIIICYNFPACCIAGYRDITSGSELSDHPS